MVQPHSFKTLFGSTKLEKAGNTQEQYCTAITVKVDITMLSILLFVEKHQ